MNNINANRANKTKKMFLPSVEKKLVDICTIIAGQSPSNDTYNNKQIGLPFYQGKADFGSISPNPRIWCSAPLRIAEKGDILLSVRAPVGPVNMASETCCIGRGLCAIRAKGEVDKDYLNFYFKIFEENISKLGSGSTFSAITTQDVKNLVIPLPRLDEQHRIAAEVERRLAIVEKAKKAATEQLTAALRLSAAYLREVFAKVKGKRVRLCDACREDKAIIEGKLSSKPYLGLEMIEAETGRINWSANTVGRLTGKPLRIMVLI